MGVFVHAMFASKDCVLDPQSRWVNWVCSARWEQIHWMASSDVQAQTLRHAVAIPLARLPWVRAQSWLGHGKYLAWAVNQPLAFLFKTASLRIEHHRHWQAASMMQTQ